VTPVKYTVRHHYRYVYTSPISDVRQRLIMIPPDRHADQRLLSSALDVRGVSGRLAIDWQTDAFGNRVCRVEAERVERALDFEARFTVSREPGPASDEAGDFADGLVFTALTACSQPMLDAARSIAARASTVRDRVELAHDWAAGSIEYRLGVTGTQTPAAMALHLGQGVCQDYAHIMLGVLRALGVPCRYVSGHLLGEGAPHAWVEVVVDDTMLAYDPTHHRRAGLNYIVVATGRDFADVTATSGVFTGSASGRLHWSKQAAALTDVDEAAA
jgi:transglutaminase-like putative cysteine protease